MQFERKRVSDGSGLLRTLLSEDATRKLAAHHGGAVGWRLSHHARVELHRRGIPPRLLEETVAHPGQIVQGERELRVYQSRISTSDGRTFLLRVIVDDTIEPMVSGHCVLTSKVDKYWRHDEDLL